MLRAAGVFVDVAAQDVIGREGVARRCGEQGPGQPEGRGRGRQPGCFPRAQGRAHAGVRRAYRVAVPRARGKRPAAGRRPRPGHTAFAAANNAWSRATAAHMLDVCDVHPEARCEAEGQVVAGSNPVSPTKKIPSDLVGRDFLLLDHSKPWDQRGTIRGSRVKGQH